MFAPVGRHRYRRGWNVVRAYGCLASVSLLHTLSSKHRFHLPLSETPLYPFLLFFLFSPVQPIPRLSLSLSLRGNVCFGVNDPRRGSKKTLSSRGLPVPTNSFSPICCAPCLLLSSTSSRSSRLSERFNVSFNVSSSDVLGH